MTISSRARAADRAEQDVEAARSYEEALVHEDVGVDVYVDLAVLYWCATDSGALVTKEFRSFAASRSPEIFSVARQRWPSSTRAAYWNEYTRLIDGFSDGFTVEWCLELITRAPSTLDPVMSVFVMTQGEQMLDEALELLSICKAQKTAAARYAEATIEFVLQSLRWRQRHKPPSG